MAIFDWLFGTLYMPTKKIQLLQFGVNGGQHLKTMVASMLYPCLHAMKVKRWFKKYDFYTRLRHFLGESFRKS